MRISSASSLTSSSLDFSNISASKLQDVNVDLYNQGKITLRQSGELSLMDGSALKGVNNGQLPTESLNAYSMLDTMIKYQEGNGIGDVNATVASLNGLKSALENYSNNDTSETSTNTQNTDSTTTSDSSSSSVDFTNMSRNQLKSWINDQIKSGNMSLDQSTPFVSMTMHLSVEGVAEGKLFDPEADVPVNFIQQTQDGIKNAIASHDKFHDLKMLEYALATMEKYQNNTTNFTA